jgi:hypothetical protein
MLGHSRMIDEHVPTSVIPLSPSLLCQIDFHQKQTADKAREALNGERAALASSVLSREPLRGKRNEGGHWEMTNDNAEDCDNGLDPELRSDRPYLDEGH